MISVTRTDVGKLRVNNQDALIVLEQLYGVADGMGGHKGGEVASAGARDGLEKFLKGKTPDPRLLKTAVEAVNRRLYLRQREEAELSGMGTTLTVLWAGEREIYLAHVGDSRAYLVTPQGELERLTRDHSVVQLLLDHGEITEEEAASHPKRHYITRALGIEPELELEYLEREFAAGWLLLCSDGLYNYAPPEDHLDLITTCASEQDIYLLIDEANKAGGPDNITAVIVAK